MTTYKLKGVSQVLFEQWKEGSKVYAGHFHCEIFKVVFETYNCSPLSSDGPTVHRWVYVIGVHDLGVSNSTRN